MDLFIKPKSAISCDEYELIEDFSINILNEEINIPKFFSYDGATIPWLAWKITYTPFDPKVMIPAVVHDWLYSNHQTNRKKADQIFEQLLIENQVPIKLARMMYLALRIGAGSHWENKVEDVKYLKSLYKLHLDNPKLKLYKFPNLNL